jgi:hypothetical protein
LTRIDIADNRMLETAERHDTTAMPGHLRG